MSDNNSLMEEIKEQTTRVVKERTFAQKLSYFFFYYKFHIVAVIIIIAAIYNIVHTISTHKEPYIQVALVNANQSVDYESFFNEYDLGLSYDRDKQITSIDSTYIISQDTESQNGFDTQAIQKIFYATAAGKIDVIVADEANFKWMAESGYFKDLGEILTSDELAEYAPLLCSYEVRSNGVSKEEISGICVDTAAKVLGGEWYSDHSAYVGIVMETERIDEAKAFIDYLFD